MLSRFASAGNANLSRCVLKFQPIYAISSASSSSASSEKLPDKKAASTPKTGHPPEFPAASDKRDYVNFPRPVVVERAPPVRFGFIPDSWFQFFYPKTGYTGPYMLIFGGLTYIYSKEILPYDHNAAHLYSLIILIMFIHMKFGDKIGEMYNKWLAEEEYSCEYTEMKERESVTKNLEVLSNTLGMRDPVAEALKGRTDSVYLQMEMHYRQRLEDAYKAVKSRLDCQAELENAENRVAQKNVLDYVTRNVMKSITPELENNTLKMCISDLNALAAKA